MTHWSAADAEKYLVSLEPIGWRFGLDRIQRLTSVMGMPQHRFASIHVVGTNGKSSVAEMVAALLEAHGVRAGAYVSPHLARWSERIRIRGREISDDGLARAVERTAESVDAVNRTLDEGDSVTQFEAATAAAFFALAAADVEVAVIEAGLGGRLDATNVIPSRVCALTSVGLEHTEWLGETEEEIAAEKLAVLRDHSTLVLGVVSAEVEALAERVAAERGARLLRAEPAPGMRLAVPGAYQRRNFAVALAAAQALLGPLDEGRLRSVAASLALPGRLELREGDPPTVLDAAHNPEGARALAEALPEVVGDRPVVACLAVLEGKDAGAIVSALASRLAQAVCTEIPAERLVGVGRPDTGSVPAKRLAELCGSAGVEAEVIADPRAAVELAREEARDRSGVALCAGSHYLLPSAWTDRRAQSSFR